MRVAHELSNEKIRPTEKQILSFVLKTHENSSKKLFIEKRI